MIGGMDQSNGTGKEDNIPSKTAVLARVMPWSGYQQSGLITARELQYITAYEQARRSKEKEGGVNALLEREGVAYAEVLLSLVTKATVLDTLQYVLTFIHEILTSDPRRVALFDAADPRRIETAGSEHPESGSFLYPYKPFFRLIGKSNSDYYSAKISCEILGILMSQSNRVPADAQEALFRYISDNIVRPSTPEAHLALFALQALLSKEQYRLLWFKGGNLPLLVKLIQTQTANFQLVYEALYCVWLMTYNEQIAESVVGSDLIKATVNVVKVVIKEKVVRLAIACLRNMLDKSTNNEEMIESGFVRHLAILSNKKWADEDIINDLKALSEGLAKNMAVLSSFDVYKKELLSGQLEWSPVHKSEKFWRENFMRFEENDYQLVKLLLDILKSNTDALTLSVACFDVGELVRFHPRGRVIIQQYGVKLAVMNLMTHPDAEVKKQSLFAVQKSMVTNWEYLAAK